MQKDQWEVIDQERKSLEKRIKELEQEVNKATDVIYKLNIKADTYRQRCLILSRISIDRARILRELDPPVPEESIYTVTVRKSGETGVKFRSTNRNGATLQARTYIRRMGCKSHFEIKGWDKPPHNERVLIIGD